MYSICIVINSHFCTSCKRGTLQLNPSKEVTEHRLALIQLYVHVLLVHYKNIMKMQYFGPSSLFGSPNVNAWYSHSVVTNTNTSSDRNTHIIQYTAVLINRLCLYPSFIIGWLNCIFPQKKKKICLSVLLCNVAFSVNNKHDAHGVGRAAINMDHGEDQKDSWLLVMFRSEKNNRGIRGKNNIWFSGHISKISQYLCFAHWSLAKLKTSSSAKEKMEDGNARMEHWQALVLPSNKDAAWDGDYGPCWSRYQHVTHDSKVPGSIATIAEKPALRTGSPLRGDEKTPVDWVMCRKVLKQKSEPSKIASFTEQMP